MNRLTARRLAPLALVVGIAAGLSGCSTAKSYSSCAAAQKAGLSLPISKGSAGYSKKLDADGDGIACDSGAGR
jgi:hypothetical protein